jgi:hypothetical protein
MVLTEIDAPQVPPRIVSAEVGPPLPNLIEPTTLGYLYLGAAVAPRSLPFVLPNARRARVLRNVKRLAATLASLDGVIDATVFRAIVAPPTARFSAYLKARHGAIPVANFDIVVLVRTNSVAEAGQLQETAAYRNLIDALRDEARTVHAMAARNVRRIADVDTTRQGLFLFNHFAAADPQMMLTLWDYLAGWFVAETGLRNSVALAPLAGENADYAIVNWARWEVNPITHFAGMLLKPSFWKYVTANLDANNAASMPVYCRLA